MNKPKTSLEEQERKLLPRLKFMGYVLSVLSVATLAFAIVADLLELENEATLASLMNEEELFELSPLEVLNFYAVFLIFALLSTFFFLLHKKKSKLLLQETKDQE